MTNDSRRGKRELSLKDVVARQMEKDVRFLRGNGISEEDLLGILQREIPVEQERIRLAHLGLGDEFAIRSALTARSMSVCMPRPEWTEAEWEALT